jgi:hypothetical protein
MAKKNPARGGKIFVMDKLVISFSRSAGLNLLSHQV